MAPTGASPEHGRRPNIVLIMTDQQRWDALGSVGVLPVQTPTCDWLASDGMRFPQTFCNSPICVPSRMSFFSGRYPHQHGCLNNGSSLWPEAPTFVRELRNVGYHTANVGKLHYTWQHDLEILVCEPLLRRLGFSEPFETTGKMSQGNLRASAYSEHLRQKGLLEAFHRDLLQRVAAGPLGWYDLRPSMFDENDHIDSWVLNHAADWIRRNEREPFFLWVGPEGPHDPFDPPEPYASLYRPEDMPLGPLDYSYPVASDGSKVGLPEATPRQIQEMRTQYLGNVTQIDAGVGRIVDALASRGQLAATWIIFCSDHGEMLGDHRRVFKSEFFQPSIQVPLIIRPPTSIPARRGIVANAMVDLLDVSATLLDLAGTSLVGHRGRSLKAKVLGGEDPDRHRDAVFSQINDRVMLCTEEWKLVVVGEELRSQYLWNRQDDL
ncbi:MAG TPA: sulfatase-like hydrolase/transferase, partial [Chloroflexota bacterium]|nr:sulfatase-like hydrolase/transferase [Chloroflexota bacterium]